MFNLLISNGGDISFSRYPMHGIPVLYELHVKEQHSNGERKIYNILVNNFNTNIHLVPLLEKIYYPFNKTYSNYGYYRFRMNKENKVNYFLKFLLNKSTVISNQNSIIRENMPKILGSLKVNLDVIKTLENAGLNLQITDSSRRNILDYFCIYFEKYYENLTNASNYNSYNYRNRNQRRSTPNNNQTVLNNYQEKVRYLQRRGLRVTKSKYKIPDNIWWSWK
jgi:hypothetical protein